MLALTGQRHIYLQSFGWSFPVSSLKRWKTTGKGSSSPVCAHSFGCDILEQCDTKSYFPLSALFFNRLWPCLLFSSAYLSPTGLLFHRLRNRCFWFAFKAPLISISFCLFSISCHSPGCNIFFSPSISRLVPGLFRTSSSLALTYSLSLQLILFLPVKPFFSLCPVPFFPS